MEVFIANPIEPVESELNKTKIVSVLFKKNKWDKDEIKKWIRSRFSRVKPKILTSKEAGYYHVRVARENKYPKRTITLSKDKGIKAIIELIPVNIRGVYNYTKDIESSDDVSYNTDMSKDVGYNIKVTPEIKDAIIDMSDLPSGVIQKLIRNRFGINISTTTINRYKKGVMENIESGIEDDMVESDVSEGEFEFEKLSKGKKRFVLEVLPVEDQERLIKEAISKHRNEYLDLISTVEWVVEHALSKVIREIFSDLTAREYESTIKYGVYPKLSGTSLTEPTINHLFASSFQYSIRVFIRIPVEKSKELEQLEVAIEQWFMHLLNGIVSNIEVVIGSSNKPKISANKVYKRFQKMANYIERDPEIRSAIKHARDMKIKLIIGFVKDLLKPLKQFFGSYKVDTRILTNNGYNRTIVNIKVPTKHAHDFNPEFFEEFIEGSLARSFPRIIRKIRVYIEVAGKNNVSYGISDIEDDVDALWNDTKDTRTIEDMLKRNNVKCFSKFNHFWCKLYNHRAVSMYFDREDWENNIKFIIKELEKSKFDNRLLSFYKKLNWAGFNKVVDITEEMLKAKFSGASRKDIADILKKIDIYDKELWTGDNIALAYISLMYPVIVNNIIKLDSNVVRAIHKHTDTENYSGELMLGNQTIAWTVVEYNGEHKYQFVKILIPGEFTYQIISDMISRKYSIVREMDIKRLPPMVNAEDYDLMRYMTNLSNILFDIHNHRYLVENGVGDLIEKGSNKPKKQRSVSSDIDKQPKKQNKIEVLGIYDRQGLMSLARAGDKLFLILNSTGAALGEVLYKAGNYVMKKGRKYIKLNSKKINAMIKNKGGK